ncbi:hypothetical protein Leryth_009711 [Lithospermum erythrorhizon]|nr:hypothetical protein Leryth_009711 [Lithospermum erythrorhizon]
MVKGMRKMSSWVEVAPSLITYPRKPSNKPELEPIIEDKNEGHDDEYNGQTFCF